MTKPILFVSSLAALVLALSVTSSIATSAVGPSDWVNTETNAVTALVLPGLTDIGPAASDTSMPLMVSLKLRNQTALYGYFQRITTPGDALYKHYLRPSEFTRLYGPTMPEAEAVINYLAALGFTNITLSPNHTQIRMTGTVGAAQAAFNTQIHQVQYNGQTLLANVTPAQVPASLGTSVLSVAGLNTVPTHWITTRKANPGTQIASPVSPSPALGPPSPHTIFLFGGYGPKDYQKAYHAGSTPDGSNTSIAIIASGDLTTVLGNANAESNAPFAKTSDLRTFEDFYGLPHVPVTMILTGFNHADGSGAGEFDIDTQSSTGIANNVKQLYVYDGAALSDLELMDEVNHYVSDDLAQAASESIGGCDSLEQAFGLLSAWEQVFLQMATQGQSFFASTGDTGSTCYNGGAANGVPAGVPGVEYPASSAYVLGVGGTSLFVNSDGTYDFESVWYASGGGNSNFVKMPEWQKTVLPEPNVAAGFKGLPDIAMEGDDVTGACIASGGDGSAPGCGVGGTSLASPLALGVWARMQSARVTTDNPNPLGFAPPDLYALGVPVTSTTPAAGFHDIVVGNNTGYSATPNWDNASGLGTLDITALNAALHAVPSAPVLPKAPTLGGDSCDALGYKLAQGVSGSNSDAPLPGHNVLADYISEHFTAGQPDAFTFSLDVDTIDPVGTVYFIYFTLDDGVEHYVAYEPTPDPVTKAPQFTYGHIATTIFPPPPAPGALINYIPNGDGSISGSVDTTKNRVTWVVPRGLIGGFASIKSIQRIFGEADAEVGFLDQATSFQGASSNLQSVDDLAEANFAPHALHYCAPAPTATLAANLLSGVAPLPVQFNGSGSKDADGNPVSTYEFDFGDGSTSGPQSTPTITHTYTAPGSHTAQLTVVDRYGKTSANTAQTVIVITSPNQAPTSSLSPTVVSVNAGAGVSFVVNVADQEGDAVNYDLDFGDKTAHATGMVTNTGGSGQTVSVPAHTYATQGSYTATLKVVEASTSPALSAPDQTSSVMVQPASTGGAPAISVTLGADQTSGDVTSKPLTVNFTATATDSDPNGGTLTYTFYYGDGTHSSRLPMATSSHDYGAAGTYHPYVIVADNNLNSATSAPVEIVTTVTVTVISAVKAVLGLHLDKSVVPATATFDGSGSTAPQGAVYRFDFGDGTTPVSGISTTAQHVYTTSGSFTATLTVTDPSYGDTSTATATVTLSDVQGTVAELTVSPTTVKVGTPVAFDASASIPGNGVTITSYTFDFNGDGSDVVTQTVAQLGAAASKLTHVYSVVGTFQPVITVTDSNSHTAVAKSLVTVQSSSVAPVPVSHGGGSLGFLTLLPLVGAGALRRRKKPH